MLDALKYLCKKFVGLKPYYIARKHVFVLVPCISILGTLVCNFFPKAYAPCDELGVRFGPFVVLDFFV